MKFKKISAVLGTILMTGLTLGTAAAASYPAPFVESGVANVAIVYGTGAGVSSLDMVQAGNIQTSLGSSVKGGTTTTVDGGEAFTLEKTSNNFNFNEDLDTIYSVLDDEDMDFLADGTYDDGDIDEDYTQIITLSDATLSLFADNDYDADKTPTVGFKWTNGDDILSYTIEFDDTIALSDMNETDMPLMGNEYYVLSADANTIELLDSAEKVSIMEGESLTVGGLSVSIYSIDSTGVRFSVDGEKTDKLSEHEYEELDDGSYIVLNTFTYDTRDGKDSFAEFSIGAGKMTLTSGEEVEINDEAVDGLDVLFDNSGDDLTSITITWNSDDESFLTEDNSLTMPAFEAITLVFGGLDFPADSEMIAVENGETLTLSMDNYELPLMWWDGTDAFLGEEDSLLILATATNATIYNISTADLTGGIETVEDNRFLVTNMDVDLSDIQTIYYEVSNIDYTSTVDFEVTLNDLFGDKDLVFDSLESKDNGDIELTLDGVNATDAYFTFSGTSLSYNKAVSDKGLVVTIPASVANITKSVTGEIVFTEADKDDDVADGTSFSATVLVTANEALHVSTVSPSTLEDSEDVYIGYVASDLASMVTLDKNADEYDFEIEYFGSEVTAEVIVAAGGNVVTTGSDALGDVLVKDTEVESVKAKNLVIVGGSCINSAAATVLGGAYCGAAFTAETGVGAGQFLIKGVQDAYTTGKLALVVAGYEAADTVNAATYLTKKDVDTSKEYKGTSATNAELVVA